MENKGKGVDEGSSASPQRAEESAATPHRGSSGVEGNLLQGSSSSSPPPPIMQPRPPSPIPQLHFPSGSSGAAPGASSCGFVGATVPVAVSGGSSGAAAGGVGAGVPAGIPIQFQCSVCGKSFETDKALFGHMRTHPERPWRGAYPPPTFDGDEDFANVPNKKYKVQDLNNPPLPPADSDEE